MLLKLNASVKFDQFIRPICLPQPGVSIREPLMEVSWGSRNVLRQEKMDLFPNSKCVQEHIDGASLTRMCVGRKRNVCENWSDVSSMMSLCPSKIISITKLQMIRYLVLYISGCALLNGHSQASNSNELLGMKTVSTYFYCEQGDPEEFVLISPHLDWIESNVWPSNNGVISASDYLAVPNSILLLLNLYRWM